LCATGKGMLEMNILGTEYTIERRNELEDPAMVGARGYIDRTSKRIALGDFQRTQALDYDDVATEEAGTIRHELIHAFFFESGLEEYGGDETLVQWIAMQLPKINKAIEEANELLRNTRQLEQGRLEIVYD